MSTNKIAELVDIRRRKLLAIAIEITDRFFHQKSISIHFIRDKIMLCVVCQLVFSS